MNSPAIFDNEQLTILNTLYQAYVDGTIALTTQTITDWNASTAYAVGRYIRFDGQVFCVKTLTTAGESPVTARGKYNWIGGGADELNTASGSTSVTIDSNSGLAIFNTNISSASIVTLTINNTLIGSSERKNISFKLRYNGQGAPTIFSYFVTTYAIVISVCNFDSNSTNSPLEVIFNIED